MDNQLTQLRAHAQNIINGKEPHDGAGIAQMLEDEIARRGNYDNYIIALSSECGISLYERNELPLTASWKLIRATPEQRARAFLAATE